MFNFNFKKSSFVNNNIWGSKNVSGVEKKNPNAR